MKSLKTIVIAAFAAFFVCALAPLCAKELQAKIIATVNSEIITSYDIKNLLENGAQNEDEAFALMVNKQLLMSLVRQFGIKTNELEISSAFIRVLDDYKLNKEAYLALSPARQLFLREQARFEVLKNKLFDYIASNYMTKQISDDEVKEFFEENLAAKGASYEQEAPKIRAFLYNQAANSTIQDFIEKEQAKAIVEIKESK